MMSQPPALTGAALILCGVLSIPLAGVSDARADGAASKPPIALSHAGLKVSDIERSTRFYYEGLGFRELHRAVSGEELGRLRGVQGKQRSEVRMLVSNGMSIELIWQQIPGQTLAPPQPQFGPYHVALMVDDLDAAIARVRQFGGTIDDERRLEVDSRIFGFEETGTIAIAIGTDPDGAPIELVQWENPPEWWRNRST